MTDPLPVLGFVVGLATVVVGVVGVLLGKGPWQEARRRRSQERFRNTRDYLKSHRVSLARAAQGFYPSAQCVEGTPLLTLPDWIPHLPLRLEALEISVKEVAGGWPQPRSLERLWPTLDGGRRLKSYSAAIAELNPPELFANRPSYRALSVTTNDDSLVLAIGRGRYFDMLDTCEAVAYELAARYVGKPEPRGAERARKAPPGRRAIGNPFALGSRCVIPGINTLTIRNDPMHPGFFMHRRHSKSVATAMGVYHVAPAGEFQPTGIDPTNFRADLDIWRNIVREYAEEFLLLPDATGTSGKSIDYSTDEPYASFERLRKVGQIEAYLLGVGVDPLSLKVEVLTACSFSAAAFDELFGRLRERETTDNEEGTLVTGHAWQGIPFSEEGVHTYMRGSDTETLPAGAACLALAWRGRSILLAGA